ncbi:Glutaredoxin and related proteins [hydrothermal vent metagenome]|uniref:Glutaredoxin and related proteins n=1 Tax=hydrothermal vent metagenome TaxID=652676 RepID=A0A1W1B9Y1_9ZZZZ
MEQKKQKKVVLFTSPTCHWCKVAKDHFKKNGIKFKEIDITKDEKAAQDCERHGCRGVPVVLVGSRWICGFDQQKIEKALY